MTLEGRVTVRELAQSGARGHVHVHALHAGLDSGLDVIHVTPNVRHNLMKRQMFTTAEGSIKLPTLEFNPSLAMASQSLKLCLLATGVTSSAEREQRVSEIIEFVRRRKQLTDILDANGIKLLGNVDLVFGAEKRGRELLACIDIDHQSTKRRTSTVPSRRVDSTILKSVSRNLRVPNAASPRSAAEFRRRTGAAERPGAALLEVARLRELCRAGRAVPEARSETGPLRTKRGRAVARDRTKARRMDRMNLGCAGEGQSTSRPMCVAPVPKIVAKQDIVSKSEGHGAQDHEVRGQVASR